jgi:hypothetical protein
MGEVRRPHRHQDKPGPKLGYAIVSSVQQPPVGGVAKFGEAVEDPLAVRREPGQRKAADVLQHYRPRLDRAAQFNGPGEQVTLVRGSELLACDRERRAWHTPGKQVNPGVVGRIPDVRVGDVPDGDLPVRPVVPKGRGRIRIQFNGEVMLEPSEFEPERLPTRSGADLHHPVLRHRDLLDAHGADECITPIHSIMPQIRLVPSRVSACRRCRGALAMAGALHLASRRDGHRGLRR